METVELAGRIILALGVVLGLIWAIAKRVRGSAGSKRRASKLIDVLGRQQLTRGASVAVVRIGDQTLIVGVTEGRVNVLGELDSAAAAVQSADTAVTASAATGQGHVISSTAPTTKKPPRIPRTAAAPTPTLRAFTDQDIPAAGLPPQLVTQQLTATKPAPTGPLSGSALSPATWKQTINALREMTVRKG